MNKITYSLLLIFIFTLPCCRYSFQGSLSTNIKSFYVEDFYTNLLDMPTNDIENKFTQKLTNNLLSSTSLKQVTGNGDVEFRGKITQYEMSEELDKLSITVEVDYINANDDKSSFKRKFSESIVLKKGDEIKDANVDELLDKVINVILTHSLYKW
jgi:hypothetical protein